MKSKNNWIKGAITPEHRGSLRRELSVPAGKKILAKKLEAAAKSGSPLEKKRANLAITLGKINRGK